MSRNVPSATTSAVYSGSSNEPSRETAHLDDTLHPAASARGSGAARCRQPDHRGAELDASLLVRVLVQGIEALGLKLEARRINPWTVYPLPSRSSARYEPSCPVIPVNSLFMGWFPVILWTGLGILHAVGGDRKPQTLQRPRHRNQQKSDSREHEKAKKEGALVTEGVQHDDAETR